jgi:hypothetical protein
VIELAVGESFVIAPGTVLGPLQLAWGAALAAVTPSAQIVPAAAAVTASLVIGRVDILLTSRFLIEDLPSPSARHRKITIRSLSRNTGFALTFLSSG